MNKTGMTCLQLLFWSKLVVVKSLHSFMTGFFLVWFLLVFPVYCFLICYLVFVVCVIKFLLCFIWDSIIPCNFLNFISPILYLLFSFPVLFLAIFTFLLFRNLYLACKFGICYNVFKPRWKHTGFALQDKSHL